jgi:predicted dehydrogenase/threonine dehydrogenase-like Zn-dependent dehydrogenase
MLQVVQHQKTGELLVEELPAPNCPANGILVKTSHSLISAGTEKTSVENAKSSLIERARRQPDQVKLVMDFIKKEGILSTYKRVKNTLESYKALGYSASGTVVASTCDEFSVGDRVAVAGAGYANHAEILAIPKNLAVKIPDNVHLNDAAYTTVASIAMQGIRQADPRLGETVAVIGLGLIGQITVQMLKAAGCRVVGLDIDESLFEMAEKCGADRTMPSNEDAVRKILAFSNGLGCDSVIITAGTSSNQPVELSMKITRKKGRVVVVGAVGMDIPRSPFYQKEIDFTISCSYGPGRYDPEYEEKGNDYPAGFVRWTENRNMSAVLDLISSGKLNVDLLTTHSFKVEEAAKAYEVIRGNTNEKFFGVLLEYPKEEKELNGSVKLKDYKSTAGVKIAFVGLGSFAQNYLMPPIKNFGAELIAVSSTKPINAQTSAKVHGFAISATDSHEIISNTDVNTVFIASRHDSHAEYVSSALKAGKNVFVEKPLAINPEQMEDIKEAYKDSNAGLMVGYNRRFSKPLVEMKKFFRYRNDPISMIYRCNAGYIPKGSWAVDPEQGGRIIGEACHFIDCMVYLTGALPVKVYASSVSSDNLANTDRDNVAINIHFSDGSIGTVNYYSGGSKSLGKEYFEAHCEGTSAIMNNFKTLELFEAGVRKMNFDGSKGHKEEVMAFLDAVKNGKEMPISIEELYSVSDATFGAELSLDIGQAVELK